MNHSPILPLLIPFIAGLLLLFPAVRRITLRRIISAIATLLLLAASIQLLWLTDHQPPLAYTLGDWPAPFGIVLVADRLAALGVLLTAILATGALLYASAGFDQQGRHFHSIFQLQLVGINGAFLTGDVFNLFVFFEIMLLASYILLAHGPGEKKSRAGFAYLILNLVGSAVFLVALGMIYGTLGTLNLADIALQLQLVPTSEAALVRLACALLISVFLLKSALLPLSFWLPHAYAAAGAPVAALFVIMTKVGIIAILRIQVIALAPAAATHNLVGDWLLWMALATIVFSGFGILMTKHLQALIAWLILGSAGTLLIVPALLDAAITSAALYYLIQAVIVGGALFLLAGLISAARGTTGGKLIATSQVPGISLQLVFLLLAITAAGMPPFAGFIGKLMLLSAVSETTQAGAIWSVILVYGLICIIGLTRAGNRLFWETSSKKTAAARPAPSSPEIYQRLATFGMLLASLSLLVCARPVADFSSRTAAQLHQPAHYIDAVIHDQHDIIRVIRP